MSMLVGFRSCGDCAHTVTSSPAGTVKMSSGTRRGASAARRGCAGTTATVAKRQRELQRVRLHARHLEGIGGDVRVDQRLLAFLARLRVAMLHAEHAVETLAADVPEEIPVVHLAGARLLAPGIVADLEVRDLAPGMIDVRDDVALVALHVIHVVEDLAGRTIYRAADGVRLVRGAQEQVRVVRQRLEHHGEVVRREDLRARAQHVDDVAHLDADRQFALEVSRHHRGPARIHAFAHFHRRAAGGQELVAELRLARGQRGLPVVAAVDDEHAHGHAEARQRFADLRLHVDRPAHESVVFERGESLRRP